MDALTALEVLEQDKAFLRPGMRGAAARRLIMERMGLTGTEWSSFQERCPVLADVIDVANEVLVCGCRRNSFNGSRCPAWPTGSRKQRSLF